MPQLGCCTSSGRAWRLRAARDTQGERLARGRATGRSGQWRSAASRAADPAAFGRVGEGEEESSVMLDDGMNDLKAVQVKFATPPLALALARA